MPRPCMICISPDRFEIESALSSSEPLRNIARRWSTTKSSLSRHRRKHMAVQEPRAPVNEQCLAAEQNTAPGYTGSTAGPPAVVTGGPAPVPGRDEAPVTVTAVAVEPAATEMAVAETTAMAAEPAMTNELDPETPPKDHRCLIGWRFAGSGDELRCDRCFPPPSALVRLRDGLEIELGLMPGQ